MFDDPFRPVATPAVPKKSLPLMTSNSVKEFLPLVTIFMVVLNCNLVGDINFFTYLGTYLWMSDEQCPGDGDGSCLKRLC